MILAVIGDLRALLDGDFGRCCLGGGSGRSRSRRLGAGSAPSALRSSARTMAATSSACGAEGSAGTAAAID